jgi:hypothetical protein
VIFRNTYSSWQSLKHDPLMRLAVLLMAMSATTLAHGQASRAGASNFTINSTNAYTATNKYLFKDGGPRTPVARLSTGEPALGGHGAWNLPFISNFANAQTKPGPAPAKSWVDALRAYHHANEGKYDPYGMCLPLGGPRSMASPTPAQIVQEQDRILIVFEVGSLWREIHMDGRKHPADVNPTYFGHSVGHWEKDTLVVDTVGYNEKTWLDYSGYMHTDQLHTVEYISRPYKEKLNYKVVIDDPGAYEEPWTAEWDIAWAEGRELQEFVCQENNKYLQDLTDDLGEQFFQ